MHHFKLCRLLSTSLIGLTFTHFVMAQSSRDYAVMGRMAWSAFECSSLASKSKNPKEQQRLFLHGYEQGLRFAAALKASKIESQDIMEEMPLAVVLRRHGPTADFILGRIFEAAQESALRNVYKTGETTNSDESQETIAKDEFWKRNCRLIGKNK